MEKNVIKLIVISCVVLVVILLLINILWVYSFEVYSFEDDYVLWSQESTDYRKTGLMFIIFEDSSVYQIRFNYEGYEDPYQSSGYFETNAREIKSLVNHIGFWHEDYKIIAAAKFVESNNTKLNNLFNNSTRFDEFMEFNASYDHLPEKYNHNMVYVINIMDNQHIITIYGINPNVNDTLDRIDIEIILSLHSDIAEITSDSIYNLGG